MPGARRVADLGCGTGSLTAELLATWPAALVLGVDSSPEMLREAQGRQIPGRLEFVLGDLRDFAPTEPLDVLVSNATLQWVPDHLSVLARLARLLAPGGVLAMQVPGNFAEPTHALLGTLVGSPRWSRLFSGDLASPASHDPADYLSVLLGAGLQASAWETTYCQLLQGGDAVLEWMKGTALRPVLTALGVRAPRGVPRRVRRPPARGLPERGLRHGAALPTGLRRRASPGRQRRRRWPASTTPSWPCRREARRRGGLSMQACSAWSKSPKPPVLAARGGCWFKAHGAEVHLGVEGDFRPAKKAHVGLAVSDVDDMAARLAGAGHRVSWDEELAPRRRFFTDDPFGNRIEILARS